MCMFMCSFQNNISCITVFIITNCPREKKKIFRFTLNKTLRTEKINYVLTESGKEIFRSQLQHYYLDEQIIFMGMVLLINEIGEANQ